MEESLKITMLINSKLPDNDEATAACFYNLHSLDDNAYHPQI